MNRTIYGYPERDDRPAFDELLPLEQAQVIRRDAAQRESDDTDARNLAVIKSDRQLALIVNAYCTLEAPGRKSMAEHAADLLDQMRVTRMEEQRNQQDIEP